VVYGARTAPGLRAWLAAINSDPATGTGLELAFDWDIVEDSDHYPFITARIPTLMLHTGLHDQYHRPSDDVELVNFAGIPAVSRLALAVVTAQADAPERHAAEARGRAAAAGAVAGPLGDRLPRRSGRADHADRGGRVPGQPGRRGGASSG
jgi:hypothetical protein